MESGMELLLIISLLICAWLVWKIAVERRQRKAIAAALRDRNAHWLAVHVETAGLSPAFHDELVLQCMSALREGFDVEACAELLIERYGA